MNDDDTEIPSNYREAIHAHDRASISAVIDRSINKPLPWVVLSTAAAFLALGYSWSAKDASDARAHAAEVLAKTADDRSKAADRDLELVKYYLTDPDTRRKDEIEAWTKFRNERSKP